MPRDEAEALEALSRDIAAYQFTEPDESAMAAATAIELATMRERFPVLTIADSIDRFLDLGDN